MAKVHSKNTTPELKVRRMVFAMGYRYRLHRKDLPGSPDLVFTSKKKVIFVHGCFWHRHIGCAKASLPKSRLDFWSAKFAANVERDARAITSLEAAGWSVLVVWQCELKDELAVSDKLRTFLQGSASSRQIAANM